MSARCSISLIETTRKAGDNSDRNRKILENRRQGDKVALGGVRRALSVTHPKPRTQLSDRQVSDLVKLGPQLRCLQRVLSIDRYRPPTTNRQRAGPALRASTRQLL